MLEFSSDAVLTETVLMRSSLCPAAPAPSPDAYLTVWMGHRALKWEIVGSGGLEHQGQAGSKGDRWLGREWEGAGRAAGAAVSSRDAAGRLGAWDTTLRRRCTAMSPQDAPAGTEQSCRGLAEVWFEDNFAIAGWSVVIS